MNPEELLILQLRQLGGEIYDANADVESETSFKEIIRAADAVESQQDRAVILIQFVSELLDRAITDKLAMRVAVMARLGVRIQSHVDADLAVRAALRFSVLLENLHDHREALDLIDPRIDTWTTDACDPPQWRAAGAMRLRLLLRLNEYERGHRIADAYEQDARRDADAFEVDVLISGAQCASMTNRPDAAARRAMQAVERLQQGAYGRRGDRFLDLLAPPISSLTIFRIAGEALRQAGLPLDAINVFQQGRKQGFRESNPSKAALFLSEIGVTWELIGDVERGAALLEQAAKEAERLGDLQAAARWRKQPVIGDDGTLDVSGFNGLAAVGHAIRSGNPTEVHDRIIKQLVKQAKKEGTQLEAMARSLLAGLHAHRGDMGQALLAIRAAIDCAEKLKSRWHALALRSHETRFLFDAGRWQEAVQLADRVLAESQRLWSEASSSEMRQTAVAAAIVVVEIILVISSGDAVNGKGKPWKKDAGRVRRVSHLTRARGFNRWLELVDWGRRLGKPEIECAIRSLIAADLAIEWTAQDGQAMNLVLQRRHQAQQSFAAAIEDAGMPTPSAEVPYDDGQCRLPPGMMAVDLGAVESGIVCLFVEPSGRQSVLHIDWERSRRNTWRARWRMAWIAEVQRLGLQRSDLRSPALPLDEQPTTVAGAVPSLAVLYAELDEVLIGPLIKQLNHDVERLVVCLHAELFFIPMWPLAQHRPDLAWSLAPSLGSIGLLASRTPSVEGPSIAIGDATGTLAMVGRECELLTGFQRIAPAIETVAQAVKNARRVHFAGHGEFDNDNPYLSGLIVRAAHQPPSVVATSRAGCGRLTILGIFDRLDIGNCELATISACSVGAPRAHAASEFTSVPTALLLAGARNVVAASWHVHDAATTVQMAHLHVELQRNRSIAAALAASRRRLASTTFAEAAHILGRQDVLPASETPFASPLFTDAMVHFGVG